MKLNFHFSFFIFHFKKAFTLIELLIYMGLLSIFLIVLTNVFVSILDVQRESQATSAVEQDGRYILIRIAHDLTQADSIGAPSGPVGSELTFHIQGKAFKYKLIAGNLTREGGSGNCDLIGDNCPLNSSETTITSLNFTNINNGSSSKDTVQVQFTIQSKTSRPQGPEVRTFQATIGRRCDNQPAECG